MRRYNDGMITTNDNCAACNHCVHVCPAVGANVTANDEGRISIDVSDKNCIHCGRCIKECIHGARQYSDSLEDLIHDLKRGGDISVIVDPTFVIAYGRKKASQVFGYLKSIGIKGIYDASIGGEISLYCHIKYLHDNVDEDGICEKYIAHTCPGFSNYVSRYAPSALDKFIPVQLPNVCAAIYYRKYKGIKGRFALLSPCTAIYDEFSSFNSGRNINYLIGYSSLMDQIKDIDISSFDAGFDEEHRGMGCLVYESGTFSHIVSTFFAPNRIFKNNTELDPIIDSFIKSPEMMEKGNHPFMFSMDLCRTGCIDGPAIGKGSIDIGGSVSEFLNMYSEYIDSDPALSPEDRYRKYVASFEDINTFDFFWEGEEDYHQKCSVPPSVVEEIFASMHKTTPVKKQLNCQACGYRSCYEMACAVANGYSRIEECVHYLNDEMKAKMGIDSLTGLYNQRGFFHEATKLVAGNPDRKYILAIGDINGLGGINDLYSSTGGDLVISHVAKVLEEFADGRGVCSRMGAGVFGCIFENTPENMEKFETDTQLSVAHLGIEYPLSIKFGLYEFSDRSVNMGRAVLYATYAFRTTKDKSRNTYVLYTEEMSKSMSAEAEVTQKMKSAMRNGEFVLYYQPKYEHTTGRMTGAEVLSRWIKPDDSIVSPGVFIPVFEKNGFINELDRHVWKSSFEAIDAWLKEGYKPVPLSVNISRISLQDESTVEYIANLGEQYHSAKEYIQFEITESAYVGNSKEIFARVERIRAMGYKINMDDFGSGYSSLNLLKDAPIDIVKLDMGFLRGEDNRDRGKVIISSIVNMTKELGFEIIAEGVEEKDQADMLSAMGCDIIQGFYYAKPMPGSEYEKLLK